jgi:hypothetical protein
MGGLYYAHKVAPEDVEFVSVSLDECC